jgi:hypothetical protein
LLFPCPHRPIEHQVKQWLARDFLLPMRITGNFHTFGQIGEIAELRALFIARCGLARF